MYICVCNNVIMAQRREPLEKYKRHENMCASMEKKKK